MDNERTERTMSYTICKECGKLVDWSCSHLNYPLCPECDCTDTLPAPSIRPIEPSEPIQPIPTITLIPKSQ